MHASALVIVPADQAADLPAAVEKIMAQYDERLYEYVEDQDNPGWWDWYRIGGRWDGHFLGLDRLPEETHYTDAWERPERNSAPMSQAAEWDTFTVVSPDGYMHARYYNPEWTDSGYSEDVRPIELETPGFHQWRAEQMMANRDGVAVIVDYHS